MGDALDRARAARNVLERMGRKVPGFQGYLEGQLTREIDQLVRAHLANSLDAARAHVAAHTRTLHLAEAGTLERLGALEKDLGALANVIRHAGSGYAGLFDALKVSREKIEAVYHLEMGFVDDVEAVAAAAESLSAGGDALEKLAKALEKVRAEFEARDQALKGVLV